MHDDKQALRECSLVCKDWAPSASSSLFYHFSWPPCYHNSPSHLIPPRGNGFCRCHSSSVETSSFIACAEVFSRSQRVSTAVQELQLISLRVDSPHEDLSVDSLLRMVDLLPRLRILYLGPKLISGTIPSDYRETSRTLHHLKVHLPPEGINIYLLFTLFTSFRCISTITCDGHVQHAETVHPKLPPPRVEVHTLRTSCLHWTLALMVVWLRRHLELASLRSLTAGDILDSELDLFIQSAMNLDKLVCTIQSFQPAASSWPPLRSLTVKAFPWRADSPAEVSALWDTIMTVLAHIDASKLQELCIWLSFGPASSIVSFRCEYMEQFTSFEWAPLRELMRRSRSLTKLRFELPLDSRFLKVSPELYLDLFRNVAIRHLPPQMRDLLEVTRV